MLDSSQRLSDAVKKELTPEEVAMLDGWEIHNGLGPVAKFQATAQIYSTRVLVKASNKLRESNESIARSNDSYAFRMTTLTAGLFFVGLVQMFIQAIQIFGMSLYVFSFFVIAFVLLFFFLFRGIVKGPTRKE